MYRIIPIIVVITLKYSEPLLEPYLTHLMIGGSPHP